MGRKAGFKSGEMFSRTAKVNDKHVVTTVHIPLQDFTLGANIDSGNTAAVISGAASLGWRNTVNSKASTTFLIPSNIPEDTKANVNIYWATHSGTANGVGVVWDIDYRTVNKVVSGTTVAATNYVTSGTVSNATTTHTIISGGNTASVTALQKTTVEIAKEDIESDALMSLLLFRDTDASGDTFTGNAHVLAVEVEFVDG